jgi:hypothetical protein
MNGERYRGSPCGWEVALISPLFLRVPCCLTGVVFSLFRPNIQKRQVTESDGPVF